MNLFLLLATIYFIIMGIIVILGFLFEYFKKKSIREQRDDDIGY